MPLSLSAATGAAKLAMTASSSAKRSAKTPKFTIRYSGQSDVGLVREGNEDSLLAHPARELFVVADGMGGHNSGEVASQFAVEAMQAFYDSDDITKRVKRAHREAVKRLPKSARDPSYHALRLRKATESANLSVFRLSQEHEALRDMGTTIVACAFAGSRLYVANVGDSRVYRLRGKKLVQLTEDHSLVNEYVKMNMLRPEDVESFPYKNVIVRAVGLHERVTVDITWTAVREGDQILLCSDGLTDLIKDAELADVLNSESSIDDKTNALVERAKDAGGHDNITALLLELLPYDAQAEEQPLLRCPQLRDESEPTQAPTSGPPSAPPPPGPAPVSAESD